MQKIYDWDGWFARGRVTLERRLHFACPDFSFVQQLRNAASKRGYSLEIQAAGKDKILVIAEKN